MPIDPAKPFDLTFAVDPNWDDMRLDQFVKAMIPSMSRTKIQKYIKQNRVEVNNFPRPANWRVRTSDEVLLRCNIPEEGADVGKHIPLDIIYEDSDILAVNKQAGLVVHPVAMHRHDTLLNALYWRYKDILSADQDISLANRLDQFTSGVILVSKHTASKRILQDDFEARVPKKTYIALVEGVLKQGEGRIELPLGPALGREDRCKIGVRQDEEGKPCLTLFKTRERFDGYTLVELSPHTGRQHQLRVHMSELGHPMVCDDRYGTPDSLILISPDDKEVSINRYALHAEKLMFIHPMTKKEMTLTAPMPQDIKVAAEALRNNWKSERRPQ